MNKPTSQCKDPIHINGLFSIMNLCNNNNRVTRSISRDKQWQYENIIIKKPVLLHTSSFKRRGDSVPHVAHIGLEPDGNL